MYKRLSHILNVSNKELDDLGVFDSFIGIDIPLYIDPNLLCKMDSIEEFENAYQKFCKHFTKVLGLLDKQSNYAKQKAQKLMLFPEIPNIRLGYSCENSSGRGIGKGLAEKSLDSVDKILKEYKLDNETKLFEILPLFVEGIAEDRMSDMIIYLLLDEFCKYTHRITESLKKVQTISFKVSLPFSKKEKEYNLPCDEKGDAILFVPKILLSSLPQYNKIYDELKCYFEKESKAQELREELNITITELYLKKIKTKEDIKEILLRFPSILNYILPKYERDFSFYDFAKDSGGLIKWAEYSCIFVKEFPLDIKEYDDEKIVVEILTHIKNKIFLDQLQKIFNSTIKETKLFFYGLICEYYRQNGISQKINYNGRSKQISLGERITVKVYHAFYESEREKLIKKLRNEQEQCIYIILYKVRSDKHYTQYQQPQKGIHIIPINISVREY